MKLDRFLQYFDKERAALWIPVIFATGIFLYFSLPLEPEINIAIYSFAALSVITIFLKIRGSYLYYVILCISIFVGGFLSASLHANWAKSPVIEVQGETVWIRAIIEKMEKMEHGHRLLLRDLDLWQKPPKGKFSADETPRKIRVTIRTKIEDGIKPNDAVAFRAILSPPPPLPAYPDGYDFSRFAWFEEIGGVGYAVSNVKPYKYKKVTEKTSFAFLENIRFAVASKISNAFEEKSPVASIAKALIVADKKAIPKDILSNVRLSGLGHLLAISGLHMALVMTGFFFIARAILAMIPAICLRYNIKKISGIIALCAGLFYLTITGFPVSAKRAYIMATIFFAAIVFDRKSTPLRAVAIAAFLVMLITPEAVVSVSFQMSFAAVIALIGSYEIISSYQRKNSYRKRDRGFLSKFFIYLWGSALSSLIAGSSIAAISIYHFGNYANYGILANIVAVPLTAFWVMPWGMISVIFMPLGLEQFCLNMMGLGIEIIINYSEYIVSLPNSNILVPLVRKEFVIIYVVVMLWLFIWNSRVRYLLLPILIIAFIYELLAPLPKPNIIVSGNAKLFAIMDKNEALAFNSFVFAKYERSQWLKALGLNSARHFREYKEAKLLDINCDKSICEYKNGENQVLFIKELAVNVDCSKYSLIVNLAENQIACENATILPKKVIYRRALKELGTHAIWLSQEILVKTSREKNSKRLWTAN